MGPNNGFVCIVAFWEIIMAMIFANIQPTRAVNPPMPLYLMAGQSNMEGHPDPTLTASILEAVNSNSTHLQADFEEIIARWYRTYDDGSAQYAYDPTFVALESAKLATWKEERLLSAAFLHPMKNVFCTTTNQSASGLTDNCGDPFGPELIFGHELHKTLSSTFTIVKVVQGGTTLGHDWLPPSVAPDRLAGSNYRRLLARISDLETNPQSIHPACASSAGCQWEMFLWFQG